MADYKDTLKEKNIALYTVWKGESLASDFKKVVDGWMNGHSTHFVISDKIGITTRQDWRTAMVDLKTMKLIEVDPANGEGAGPEEMIEACEKLDK